WVFPTVAVGLSINVVTGILLFMQRATTLATAIPFLIKIGLVIASAATLAPLRSIVMESAPDEVDVSSRGRALAIASILAWAGPIRAGRLLAYLIASSRAHAFDYRHQRLASAPDSEPRADRGRGRRAGPADPGVHQTGRAVEACRARGAVRRRPPDAAR